MLLIPLKLGGCDIDDVIAVAGTTVILRPDVVLKNGTAASFQTRQRPQLVFNEDGSPSYLFTSGSFEGNNPDLSMLSHTFAHKFN